MATQELRLTRGGPGAAYHCPSCDVGLDLLASGSGPANCPMCDAPVVLVDGKAVLHASALRLALQTGGDRLTPHERRVSRDLSLDPVEVLAARLPE